MSSLPDPQHARVSVRLPWIARKSQGYRALVSSSVALIVFLGGGLLDWLVTRQYLPSIFLPLAGATVGLAVGLAVFRILTDVHEHHQVLVDRLQEVIELNHHIRNALQVIVYHNVPDRSEEAIQQVKAAVVRIESILRELRPADKQLGSAGTSDLACR